MLTKLLIIFVLSSLVDEVVGETIYYLRNNGLYNSDIPMLYRDFSRSRVTMCYNGLHVFIAEGTQNPDRSTIYMIPGNQTNADEEPTPYLEIDGSNNIAIDCCCQYVVYGYPDLDNGKFKIHLRSTERDGISIDFYIDDKTVKIGAINVLCDEGLIRFTTQKGIYMFNIMNPAEPEEIIDFPNFFSHPRCSDTWSDGTTTYLLTSFEDRDLQITTLDGNFARQPRNFVMNGVNLKTACISVDGDFVYSFSRVTLTDLGALIKVPAATVINSGSPNGAVDITNYIQVTFHLYNGVSDFVNGLSICVDCAFQPCIVLSSVTCLACSDVGFKHCGFCSVDRTSCLCHVPQDAACNYDYYADAEACQRPVEKLDAYCVVFNPEAHRRKGAPVEVGVVVSPGDRANCHSGFIHRVAKTGRWPERLLPISEPIPINEFVLNGYSAEAQKSARGRRFGFFSADIVRLDGIEESIYCMSTEKSAFRNKVFTYVGYEGGEVTMEVIMDNSQFQQQVSWRVTNINTKSVRHLSNRGKLQLTINPLFKRSHEGLYEVYRVTRYLRTWHPLLFLYVRACPKERYGWHCELSCPFCGNGICDVSTGQCRCYPGFTGTDCLTPCNSPDLIGQNCDVRCSGILPLFGKDCINLEICGAEDLGCGCRSGLQPPDCIYECTSGTWGPRCSNLCSCRFGQICDPRVGCI